MVRPERRWSMARPMASTARALESVTESSLRKSSHGKAASVGTVVVSLYEGDDRHVPAYQPSEPATGAASGKHHFLALLAPSSDAALQYLSAQPPGAYLLVREPDSLSVYVKFRKVVRPAVLLKAKDLKYKHEEAFKWGQIPMTDYSRLDVNSPLAGIYLTPVHSLLLMTDAFMFLEQCWKRFLPQVQAIVFELCGEPYMNEEATLEHWSSCTVATHSPRHCLVLLTPQSCGFYILATTWTAESHLNTNAVVPVRHVEFDFLRCVVVVTDGTFNPSALMASTHFSNKRVFDADLTFMALRDNFLSPDAVVLKETTVGSAPEQLTSWQNCVEFNSTADSELQLLGATLTACNGMIPYERLSDTLLERLRDLHLFFMDEAQRLHATNDEHKGERRHPSLWAREKMRIASQILPYLLELLVSAAISDEPNEHKASISGTAPSKKQHLLFRFARAMRFNVVCVALRSDEATIVRLAHHVFQLFSMRAALPGEFIELVCDLVTQIPQFRLLFHKNNGPSILWRAVHMSEREITHAPSSISRKSILQSMKSAMEGHTSVSLSARSSGGSSISGASQGRSGNERRSSLFGMRKPPTHARQSLDFGTTFSIPLTSKVIVLLRCNPETIQTQLAAELRPGQFDISTEFEDEFVATTRCTFCFCNKVTALPHEERKAVAGAGSRKQLAIWEHACCRRGSRPSTRMSLYECILQLALDLFVHTTTGSWDRNVAALLRLESLHESLFHEAVRLTAHIAAQSRAHEICERVYRGLTCRSRVITLCMSALFRLETKRRQLMKSSLGEKKYWQLFHLFRNQLRNLNDFLTHYDVKASEDEDDELREDEEEVDDDQEERDSKADSLALLADKLELQAHLEILSWIPKPFVTEWLLVSLEDFLNTATALSDLFERTNASDVHPDFLLYTRQLLRVFAIFLRRISDIDLQELLLRVLDRGCPAIVDLLERLMRLVGDQSKVITRMPIDECTSYSIQHDILAFADAFVTLDMNVPIRTQWFAAQTHEHCDTDQQPGDAFMCRADADTIEQRKAVLMGRILSPEVINEHDDQTTLWDFLMRSANASASPQRSGGGGGSSAPSLPVIDAFRSPLCVPVLPLGSQQFYLPMLDRFLTLQQKMYVAQIADLSPGQGPDLDLCVTSHMNHINEYCQHHHRFGSTTARHADDEEYVQHVIGLHLKCLVILANRRRQSAQIESAFTAQRILPSMLERLQSATQASLRAQRASSSAVHFKADYPSPGDALTTEVSSFEPIEKMEETRPVLSPMRLLNFGDMAVSRSSRSMSNMLKTSELPANPATAAAAIEADLLMQSEELRALVVLLIISLVVHDSTLELDETFCPRFSVPQSDSSSSGSDNSDAVPGDLLWSLQTHLSVCGIDGAILNRMIQELDFVQAFLSAPRVAAINSLLRLLSPNSFDRILYTRESSAAAADEDAGHQDDEDSNDDEEEDDQEDSAQLQAKRALTGYSHGRKYIAKGAFATVFASAPWLSQSPPVAVKVLPHQTRAGDLCAMNVMYHEVLVLRRLQGERAACQMLDFGNHHESQSLEIVMEYCPCTLTEWRAFAGEGAAPFRSLLVMILRAFASIGRCLERIHAEEVGHFDIKGDNVLIRTNAHDLCCYLLQLQEEEPKTTSAPLPAFDTHFCFGDFGESMVARTVSARRKSANLSSNASRSTLTAVLSKLFPLTRTRGTEAIKSPEMLAIKGSDEKQRKTLITYASDVWSLGCLLYEMIAQQLIFAKDDWAGLYAHLVLETTAGSALREDHEQTLVQALQPAEADQQQAEIVQDVVALVRDILVRLPGDRPSLAVVLDQADALLARALALPITASDQSYMDKLRTDEGPENQAAEAVPMAEEPAKPDAASAAAGCVPICTNHDSSQGSVTIMARRLFGNLHLGQVKASEQPHWETTGAIAMAMDQVKAQCEDAYDHFVYVCFEDATLAAYEDCDRFQHKATGSSPAASYASLLSDVDEEERRTCIFMNSAWKAPRDPGALLRQILVDAPLVMPLIQRRLRQQVDRVLLVAMGSHGDTIQALDHILTSILLVFLSSCCSLSPMDAIGVFARRDLASHLFAAAPQGAMLNQLEAYMREQQQSCFRLSAIEREVSRRRVFHCRCGFVVLTVPVAALPDLQPQCSCTDESASVAPGASGSCNCFRPFPIKSSDQDDVSMTTLLREFEAGEMRLLEPMDSAKDPVTWRSVPMESVARLPSVMAAMTTSDASAIASTSHLLSPRMSTTNPAAAAAHAPDRKRKKWLNLHGRRDKGSSDSLLVSREDEGPSLVRGMVERAYRKAAGSRSNGGATQRDSDAMQHSSSEHPIQQTTKAKAQRWRLYECALCCLPMCAVSTKDDVELVALPVTWTCTHPV